jgi:hypothetical protein
VKLNHALALLEPVPRRGQLDKKGRDENSHDEVNEYERNEILDISRHDSILAIRENKLVDRWSELP